MKFVSPILASRFFETCGERGRSGICDLAEKLTLDHCDGASSKSSEAAVPNCCPCLLVLEALPRGPGREEKRSGDADILDGTRPELA